MRSECGREGRATGARGVACAGIGGVALALAAVSAARGQYLGTLTWEADDGTGWTAGRLETSAQSVRVRLRAAWYPAEPALYFAGCQFDAVVSGDGRDDVISDFDRTVPMKKGATQTLVATRFGDVVKIDDRRDTMPPGQGPRGIFPGQLVEQFAGWPPPTHDNPVSLFEFTLTFDGVAGERRVSSLYVAPSGGNTIDRVMRIYTNSSGAQINPSTTTFTLDIAYVPGPGGAALAGVALAFAVRRRRAGR